MELIFALFWALLVLAVVAAIPVFILYFTVTMTEGGASNSRAFLEFVGLAIVLTIFLPVYISIPGAFSAALVFHKKRASGRSLESPGEEAEGSL